MKEVLLSLLSKSAIERVIHPRSPGFFSRLFLVPKKGDSWRPVIDLSILNLFVPKEHFKMETFSSVKAAIRQGDWTVSLDLSDAYFHIPIHPASRKYLRFSDGLQTYQFKGLPLGLSSAPRIFTRLMLIVGAFLRTRGIRLIQYLDDWLILNQNRSDLIRDLEFVANLISNLGLLINVEKSEIVPSQDFIFIGVRFQTVPHTMSLPETRISSTHRLLLSFKDRLSCPARQILSLLGTLNSCADLLPLGRLHMRPLQMLLLHQWKPHKDHLHTVITLSHLFHHHLDWWLEHLSMGGVSLRPPPPSLFLFTDASMEPT